MTINMKRCYETRVCVICGTEFKVVFSSKIKRKECQEHGKKRKQTCSKECSKKLALQESYIWRKNEYATNIDFRKKRLDYMKTYNKTRVLTPEQIALRKKDSRDWQIKNKSYLRELKRMRKKEVCKQLGNKCLECGLEITDENLCMFDIHHTNPKEKEGEKRWMNKNSDLTGLELLCSNHHRQKHWKLWKEKIMNYGHPQN